MAEINRRVPIDLESGMGYLRGYFGYLILLGGIMATALVVRLEFWAFLGPAIGIAGGGAASVLVNRYEVQVERPELTSVGWKVAAIGLAIYVFGMIAIYRPVTGTRPLAHYVLHGAMAVFIAYQILTDQRRSLIAIQTLVLAFLTFWGSQFAFPAGAFSPDTIAFVPAVQAIINTGAIESVNIYGHTPAHMVYVASFAQTAGISSAVAYRLLSTLCISLTVLVLLYADSAVPGLSGKAAQVTALLFVLTSYTIGKGGYPTKLSFFYPAIPIVVLSVLKIATTNRRNGRYLVVALVLMIFFIFGHTYSGGATMIIVGAIWLYWRSVPVLGDLDYNRPVRTYLTAAVGSVVLIYLAYTSIVTGEMTVRIGRVGLAIYETLLGGSSGGGTGGGRYSRLSLVTILSSTSAQTLLFVLSMLGTGIAVRRRERGLDAIVFWILSGFLIIAISIFGNAQDIPTQRIYSLLALFGLNIACAIALLSIDSMSGRRWPTLAIVFLFAVLSMSSPVAGIALSPYQEDIPSFRKYDTAQNDAVSGWVEEHTQTNPEPVLMIGQAIDAPILELSESEQKTRIDRSEISPGVIYMYTELAAENGVLVDSGGTVLGSRRYAYIQPPRNSGRDDRIYANGEATLYVRSEPLPLPANLTR